MKLKKILACIICFLGIFTSSTFSRTNAIDPASIILSGINIAGNAVSVINFLIDKAGKVYVVASNNKAVDEYMAEVKKYGGYKSVEEIVQNVKAVISGESPIKVYGQSIAKRQCFDSLAGCLERISGTYKASERRGNIVYMIGSSGTGKTTMARAIANAFLNHDEHTCCFIECSQINRQEELGTQLFRTVNKIMNIKASKEKIGFFKTIFGEKVQDNTLGGFDAKVAAPILEHILKWDGKAVIIIDEYKKKKKICRQPGFGEASDDDKTADEILKSIASNGYYMVGSEKIDCSKALFIITTNESREDLEENFGQNGIIGGGVQRLNIIEFQKLDKECSKNIISNMIKEIKLRLTDKSGVYKIESVKFPEETLECMADYITNNETKQGRAKDDLWDKIFGVCLDNLQNFKYQSIEIEYKKYENVHEIGDFSVKIVDKQTRQPISTSTNTIDYSDIDHSYIDYSDLDTSFVDYSL